MLSSTVFHSTNTPGDWDNLGGVDMYYDFAGITYTDSNYCEGSLATVACESGHEPTVERGNSQGVPPLSMTQMSCQDDGDGGVGWFSMPAADGTGGGYLIHCCTRNCV